MSVMRVPSLVVVVSVTASEHASGQSSVQAVCTTRVPFSANMLGVYSLANGRASSYRRPCAHPYDDLLGQVLIWRR